MVLVRGVLIVSMIYAVLAAFAFALFNSPSAGICQIHFAILGASIACFPYVLLIFASRWGCQHFFRSVTFVSSVASAALGLLAYFGAFHPNDGEFALTFLVVPAVQSLVALPLAMWAAWRSHNYNRSELQAH